MNLDNFSRPRAALHNLGCKVNAYETEAMREILEAEGYTIVDFNEQADVYVVNTCTVTNIADRKSRQMLHRARKLNPDAIVVATGCYVQTSDLAGKSDDAIDIYIGTNEKSRIAEAIDEYRKKREQVRYISDMTHEGTYEAMKVRVSEGHARAFIKVQDGCNQFCSYCIIPFARGRIRSAAIDDVVSEITELSARGFKEVVLTGIHLTSYSDDGRGLLELICAIDKIDGIERIRLGSLEPGWISENVAQTLSSLDSFCPHFHLSLQSGSAGVLSRMNRKYTPDEFMEKCNILRRYFDDPALTTDIIVGFPGETEEEFSETLEFVRAVRFYEVHVFKYSMRQGTAAAARKDQIPDDIKTRRSHKLMELAAGLKADFEKSRSSLEVLIEEYTDGCYKGHSREYIEVTIPADATVTDMAGRPLAADQIKIGEIYRV